MLEVAKLSWIRIFFYSSSHSGILWYTNGFLLKIYEHLGKYIANPDYLHVC